MPISLWKVEAPVLERWGLNSFMAIISPVRLFRERWTEPKEPEPIWEHFR